MSVGRRRVAARNRGMRFGSAGAGSITPVPPGGNIVQDDLNSGGAGVNSDIQDDLNSGGAGVNSDITDP